MRIVEEYQAHSESKRVGEALCNAYVQAHQMDYVIPRLSRVYGPTMLMADSKAIAQFIKKAAALTGEPVARSQARRICNRLEEFKEVVLDFDRVEVMGQGFADELFRVYALAHPQVILCPINMVSEVEQMIRHVSRGQVPENVQMLIM